MSGIRARWGLSVLAIAVWPAAVAAATLAALEGSADFITLVHIDPQTGERTVISHYPGGFGAQHVACSYDASTNSFHALISTQGVVSVISVNAVDGTVLLQVPLDATVASGSAYVLDMNTRAPNSLFMAYELIDGVVPIISDVYGTLDATSGNVTVLSQQHGLSNWFQNLGQPSTLDPVTNTWYTIQDSQGLPEFKWALLGIDIMDGKIKSNVSLPASTYDYVADLDVSLVDNKLYGLCSEASEMGIDVCTIDRDTGHITPLDAMQAQSCTELGTNVVDPVHHLYYVFIGMTNGAPPDSIGTVDLAQKKLINTASYGAAPHTFCAAVIKSADKSAPPPSRRPHINRSGSTV